MPSSFQADVPSVELTLEIDPLTVFTTPSNELPHLIQRMLVAKKFDLTDGALPIRQTSGVDGRMIFKQRKLAQRVEIPLYPSYIEPGSVIPVDNMETVLRANKRIYTSEQRIVKPGELFIYEGGRLPREAIAEVHGSQDVLAQLRKEREAYRKRFVEAVRASGRGVDTLTAGLPVPEGRLPSTFEILVHGVFALLYAGAKGIKNWLHAPSRFCFCDRCSSARRMA